MKIRHTLLFVTAIMLNFSAGAWCQDQHPAAAPEEPRKVLQRSSAEFLTAIEELKKSGTRPGLEPSQQDQLLLALHDLERVENSAAIYNFGIYHMYRDIWSAQKGNVPVPVLLEIGPGVNIAQGVIFAMTGTKKYYALDIYRDPQFYNPYSYQAAATLLSTVDPHAVTSKAETVFRVEGDKVVFNPEKIEYLYPHQSYDIPLPASSVNYVFSHSVFEHISDPEATIKALFQLLPSGGLTAHHFDLRDHTDFSKPLEFLKFDAASWKSRFDERSVHMYTNRWRLPDFKAMFEKVGFRILKIEPTSKLPVTEDIRRSLHPDFQKYSLEDLSVLSAIIVAEKP
jgi:SAM-dependent methyltransferase